jgi:hypothetical protein
LSRAQLAEERKKQGGSEEAVKARWACPDHPGDAVVETIAKHYRCTVCDRSHSPPTIVRRIPGADEAMQVESGREIDPVELFGSTFATTAGADPIQVATVNSLGEEPHQVATGSTAPPRKLIPAPTYPSDEYELAAGPRYWGEAPPAEPEPPKPAPITPRSQIAGAFRRPPPRPFRPSAEWQVIPDGYPCPPGGEYRVDFETGKNWARWPAQDGAAS